MLLRQGEGPDTGEQVRPYVIKTKKLGEIGERATFSGGEGSLPAITLLLSFPRHPQLYPHGLGPYKTWGRLQVACNPY